MKQILFVLCILLATSCSNKGPRETLSFNDNWKFSLTADSTEATAQQTDDSAWRTLNLPHDWSIEADFSRKYPATTGGGALPGGMGWYRKHFVLPASDKGKMVYIDFDGIYRNSKVWINGQLLGFRPNGYISFRYDLTPYLKYGEENLLVVQADNSRQPNSRWYSGSGIYRNVRLTKTGKVHVDNWGTYITTPEVTMQKATVSVETTIKNNAEASSIELTTRIKSKEGKIVAQAVMPGDLQGGESTTIFSQELTVEQPQLWSLDNPYQYTAVTEVRTNGKLSDVYETPFGIRTFKWDNQTGFYLNGQALKILGVCLHHDLGSLGTAVNTRALERELQIMKDMGVNAIRTSHNPPAPELLEICDRIGLLVQDESFDMWRRRKSRFDYAQYFDEWHKRDLTDQVLRDRNHASVFMWSIGNEVLEQWTNANADNLTLEEANLILNAGHAIDPSILQDTAMTVEALITYSLADIVRKLDDTRVITAGSNNVDPSNHLFRSNALDVYGFNYHHENFPTFSEDFPGKTLIVSESTSGLMTRGIYEMPSDSLFIRPNRWDRPFNLPQHICSAYDNCRVPWGSTHEVSWNAVKNSPFVSGMFVWTGFDYLGEPTPYGWPSRSSFFGIVDLAGFPKDVYYMYQSEWTDKPVLHLFPHWNWTEGEEVDVWAYYNQADEVELFLNNQSLGARSKTDTTYHVTWRVPFTPGTLKAVSRKGGKEVLTQEIHTAGEASRIVMTPDRSTIQADGTDLSFVTVEIQDKDGNIVPNANNLLHFSVQGNGFIAGTDNGNQNDSISLKNPDRHAFSGKALVVVQNNGKKGNINLKATSDKFSDATIEIHVK
ncbi:hypothetical protein AGMMS49574_00500 [Bacteroidia bacterium]|nr:hypothetical protein AGMMS49574_00500 [Bacteroidia bacterium]